MTIVLADVVLRKAHRVWCDSIRNLDDLLPRMTGCSRGPYTCLNCCRFSCVLAIGTHQCNYRTFCVCLLQQEKDALPSTVTTCVVLGGEVVIYQAKQFAPREPSKTIDRSSTAECGSPFPPGTFTAFSVEITRLKFGRGFCR